MQLGPDQVLLNVDTRFNCGLGVPEPELVIDRMRGTFASQIQSCSGFSLKWTPSERPRHERFGRRSHRHHPTAQKRRATNRHTGQFRDIDD